MEQKPLILSMEEAKREFTQCVNDIMQKHGLNCYLIMPMFGEIYAQIKAEAHNELERAKAQFNTVQND